MSSYIYLLKEREFIKTKEDIYKIGKTRQNNGERFKQYPKGSLLILQKICNDCDKTEKILLIKFKEQFKQRKDIGAEYFEGNRNDMCKEIEDTINGENDNCSDIESPKNGSSEEEDYFMIDTYEKLIKFTCIQKIVIIDKTKLNGFLKSANWRKIKDINETDFDEENDDHLDNWIKNNIGHLVMNKTTKEISIITDDISKLCCENRDEFNKKYRYIDATYDLEKIKRDVLKKCYVKTPNIYKLKYHEYLISKTYPNSDKICNVIFDLLSFEMINIGLDKIMPKTSSYTGRVCLNIDSKIDINIVNEIFMKWTNNDIKKINEFKALCYNTFVEPNSNIIFYDCSNAFSFTSLLITISLQLSIYNETICYVDETNYKKLMKNKKRVYVSLPYERFGDGEFIVKYAQKNNISNLIIKNKIQHANYNLEAIDEYFDTNKEKIKSIITENDAGAYFGQIPETIIEHGLMANILKWIIS